MQGNRLVILFYIPSFYGALTWGIWLILYSMSLIKVNDSGDAAATIYLVTELFFIMSTICSYSGYRKIFIAHISRNKSAIEGKQYGTFKLMLLFLHTIGFLGLIQWLRHIIGYFGGFDQVLFAFLSSADTIRSNSDLPTTVGIQLTYFGWIAVALTVYAVVRKQISKKWLLLALLQLAGNFLYIGRTQPIWVMFTSFLMVLAAFENIDFKKVVTWMVSLGVVFLIVFWVLGEWTGKTYHEGVLDDPRIPGITQVMYAYGVSGFAYFNHMLVNDESIAYKPERVLYPLQKLLSKFGLTEEPPSQILEFYDVPFGTNVGTFLEPFYRDGGLLFVVFGVLLYSFGVDLLGLVFLKYGKPLALYAWSTLCFTTAIAFMTPKITQFPVWLFVGLGLISLLAKPLQTHIVAEHIYRS